MRGILRVVAVLRRAVLDAAVLHGAWVGGRAADLLGDEMAAKGGEVGEGKVRAAGGWVLVERGRRLEVVDGQRGEDRDDDVVVAKVGVNLLADGECLAVIVKGGVDRGVANGNVLMVETGDELLEVANALSTTSRVAVAVQVVV